MRHEKIIKRSDGSKVRINIEFRAEWSRRTAEWSFSVDYCEKGKRTYFPSCNVDSYEFRKLSPPQKAQAIREESLKRASPEEIESAMLELWETLKPSVHQPSQTCP
jgi:hypothetical protein